MIFFLKEQKLHAQDSVYEVKLWAPIDSCKVFSLRDC